MIKIHVHLSFNEKLTEEQFKHCRVHIDGWRSLRCLRNKKINIYILVK